MLEPIVIPSPDKKYKAVLTYVGEIQADQVCYSLLIDGFPHLFTDRLFGQACLWSPDSRILTIQEWKNTDEEAGEPTFCVLLVIDLVSRRECIIANVEGTKGKILPESFIGESLMYTVIYYGQFGMTKSFESKFQYLDGWQTLK
jgi:hypothetical protein